MAKRTAPTATHYREEAARYYAQAKLAGERAAAAQAQGGAAALYMAAIKSQLASLDLAVKAEAKAKRLETAAK